MAKRSRKKGDRRAYLKRWSSEVINTGQSADGSHPTMKGYIEAARGLAEDVPITKSLLTPTQAMGLADKGIPRAIVIKSLIVKKEKKNEFTSVVISNSKLLRYNLCWNGHQHYFFQEINKKNEEMRTSITYGSKSVAMEKFYASKITWVERRKLPANELPG